MREERRIHNSVLDWLAAWIDRLYTRLMLWSGDLQAGGKGPWRNVGEGETGCPVCFMDPKATECPECEAKMRAFRSYEESGG